MKSYVSIFLSSRRLHVTHGLPTTEETLVSVTTFTCHVLFLPLSSGPLKRIKALGNLRVPVAQMGARLRGLSRVGSGEVSMGFATLGRMVGCGDDLGMQLSNENALCCR